MDTVEITWVTETDKTIKKYHTRAERPEFLRGDLSASLEVYWDSPGIAMFEFYPLLDKKPVVAPTRRDMLEASKYMAKLAYGFSAGHRKKYDPRGPSYAPLHSKDNGNVLTRVTVRPGSSRTVRSYCV